MGCIKSSVFTVGKKDFFSAFFKVIFDAFFNAFLTPFLRTKNPGLFKGSKITCLMFRNRHIRIAF